LSKIRDSILGCSDKILGIREQIGAQINDVYLITRTWSGERVGDGSFSDKREKISPTPQIVDYSHNIRVTDIGSVKAGDLLLKGISINKYPDELTLRTDTGNKRIEKLYNIGKHFYRSINIKENLITWDLQVRKILQDETERR
jgi:hypothetical protein